MKIIVRVQLVTDWGEVSDVDVAEIQRPSGEFESKRLGLSLGDGKQIMSRMQQAVASAQTDEFCELQRVCPCCCGLEPLRMVGYPIPRKPDLPCSDIWGPSLKSLQQFTI
jgi:hypothetical protein